MYLVKWTDGIVKWHNHGHVCSNVSCDPKWSSRHKGFFWSFQSTSFPIFLSRNFHLQETLNKNGNYTRFQWKIPTKKSPFGVTQLTLTPNMVVDTLRRKECCIWCLILLEGYLTVPFCGWAILPIRMVTRINFLLYTKLN